MTDTPTTDIPAPKDLDASTALIVGGTAGIGLATAPNEVNSPPSRSPNSGRPHISSPVTPPIPPAQPPLRQKPIKSCRVSTS